jgi:hypothetical protein
VVEITRTPQTDDLPAFVRRQIATAIRVYYEACKAVNGPSCQHLVLHSEVDDPEPLTAILIVVPENKETSAWIESVNSQASRSWDTLKEWAAVMNARNATRDGR